MCRLQCAWQGELHNIRLQLPFSWYTSVCSQRADCGPQGGAADISSASSSKAEHPPSPDVTHTFLTFGSPNLQSTSLGANSSGGGGGGGFGDGSPASEGLRHCFSDRSPGLAPASCGSGGAAEPPVVLAPLNDSGGGGAWPGGGGGGGGAGQGTPSLPSAQWLLSPLMGCRDSPGPFSCLRSRCAVARGATRGTALGGAAHGPCAERGAGRPPLSFGFQRKPKGVRRDRYNRSRCGSRMGAEQARPAGGW
jgi:hypothetical protein